MRTHNDQGIDAMTTAKEHQMENEQAQHDRQEATWRDECMRLRAAMREIAPPATEPADVVEIHAETILGLCDYAALDRDFLFSDLDQMAADVRAFVAKATA